MFSSAHPVFGCLAFVTLLSVCDSQSSSLCRSSEVLRECGGCQKTCRDPVPVCPDVCRLGCYCDGDDLVRDDNGICIKFKDCPKIYKKIRPPVLPNCREDEVFEECGVCNRTCDYPNPICPAQCQRGCFCIEGLVRDLRNGQCVPEGKCPKVTPRDPAAERQCGNNEVFDECSVCEPTCEDPNPFCPAECKRGCFCRSGHFRDLQTNLCVLRNSCTNSKDYEKIEEDCEDIEMFWQCGMCEPTCGNPKPICPAQCKRGCFCEENLVRDVTTNNCIPRTACRNTAY